MFCFSIFRLPGISLAGMKVLKAIRSRGGDTMPGCDMIHGSVDRSILVQLNG